MNNGFGPLYMRRQQRAWYCGVFILVVSISTHFAYLSYLTEEGHCGVALFLLSGSVLAMFLGELLRRCCLLAEEVYHKQERYDGDWKRLVTKVYSFQNAYAAMFFGFFVLMAGHFYYENRHSIWQEGGWYYVLLFQNVTMVPIIGYLAGIKGPAEVERSEMNEKNNKNLADGLAWSYYFGYLKLVLPHLDKQVTRSSQELRERLDPVKLIILLPKNCFCYDTLDVCDGRVQSYRNLIPLELNRGGIQKRQYHHTAHKITIGGKSEALSDEERKYQGEYICLIEYATPLRTLYDMCEHAQISVEERLNQVKIFFNKLKEILDDDPQCKGKYQLIPLADTYRDLAITIVKSIKNSPVDVSSF